jgi:CDP-diacylglycerol--serine O-phosphatidyltransferase
MIASAVWFVGFLREFGLEFSIPEALAAGGTAILGLLMVSAIPYRNFKELDLRHSYGTLVFMVFAIALIIQEPSVTLFLLGVVYCASGPVEWLWRWRTGRSLELSEATPPQPNEG